MIELAGGVQPASPTPTSTRQISSITKPRDHHAADLDRRHHARQRRRRRPQRDADRHDPGAIGRARHSAPAECRRPSRTAQSRCRSAGRNRPSVICSSFITGFATDAEQAAIEEVENVDEQQRVQHIAAIRLGPIPGEVPLAGRARLGARCAPVCVPIACLPAGSALAGACSSCTVMLRFCARGPP